MPFTTTMADKLNTNCPRIIKYQENASTYFKDRVPAVSTVIDQNGIQDFTHDIISSTE
jgi:hypothetical protein